MRYFKMNGAGNDFVILDARAHGGLPLSPEQAKAIADRNSGVGCDQVIALERSIRGEAFMRIWNSDGGEVEQCGNAARCIGWLLMEESGRDTGRIETPSGMLHATRRGDHLVEVDMGSPLLRWEEIPIARNMDTVKLDYSYDAGLEVLSGPGAVSMGNPHVVFFVENAETIPARAVGPKIETDPFFPQGVNVGFAQILAPDRIRLRVWERGAGLTKACGTGACASVVAAARQGRTGREADVIVDGGTLHINWRAGDDRVLMTGPVELEAKGDLTV